LIPPRVATGAFYLAGWLVLAVAGGPLLALAVAGLSCIALIELRYVAARRRVRLAVEVGYPVCLGFVWSAYAFANDPDSHGLAIIGLILFAVLADFAIHLRAETRMPTAAVSITLLGCIYCGLLPSLIVSLRGLQPELTANLCGWQAPLGMRLLLFLLAVTMFSDVGGFVVGRLMGRHKLTRTASPNKSVEGLIGAVLFAVVAAVAMGALFRVGAQPAAGVSSADVETASVLHRLVLGLLLGVGGQLGDIGASIFKREAEVKDYGWLFPGHGGVLDRLDSLLVNAPLLYLYAKCAL
jgi:phosphatidate cytidylyltransferase